MSDSFRSNSNSTSTSPVPVPVPVPLIAALARVVTSTARRTNHSHSPLTGSGSKKDLPTPHMMSSRSSLTAQKNDLRVAEDSPLNSIPVYDNDNSNGDIIIEDNNNKGMFAKIINNIYILHVVCY